MTEIVELKVVSSYGEAWRGPDDLYKTHGRDSHFKVLGLMHDLSNIANKCDGLESDNSTSTHTLQPIRGRRALDGGVPVTTYTEILTIAGAAYTAFLAFIKTASPIIVEFMKNHHIPPMKIKIKKNDFEIEVSSEEDLNKAIRLLEELSSNAKDK